MYQNIGPGSAHQTPGGHHAPTPSTGDVLMVHDLKKEMRRKEQDFQKQNAILKQQVQLLEM